MKIMLYSKGNRVEFLLVKEKMGFSSKTSIADGTKVQGNILDILLGNDSKPVSYVIEADSPNIGGIISVPAHLVVDLLPEVHYSPMDRVKNFFGIYSQKV
jgi:hypothetical protein